MRIKKVIILTVHKQIPVEVIELGALELRTESKRGEYKLLFTIRTVAFVQLQFGH